MEELTYLKNLEECLENEKEDKKQLDEYEENIIQLQEQQEGIELTKFDKENEKVFIKSLYN